MRTRAFTTSVTTSWAPLPSKNTKSVQSVTVVNRTGADMSACHTADTGDADAGATLGDGESAAFAVNASLAEVSVQADAGATGVEFLFDE